jgi:hypothetical protein
VKDLNKYFTNEDTEMEKEDKKRCSSRVVRKLQIEMTMSYHYTPMRMAKIQNTENAKCW